MADLITLEQYKLYLNKNYISKEVENEFDIYYTNILLPGCTKALQRYFDNDFQSTSRTETFSIEKSETKKIYPRYKPISSITSVTIDDTTLSSDNYKLLSDQNAIVLSSSINLAGLVYESYYWPMGHNNVVVVYTGGYALERGDYYLLCKLIAKIDDNDVANFSSVEVAEERFFSELEQDSPFINFINQNFRNFNI